MKRTTDRRGAARRKPTTFGEEIGLDIANAAPAKLPTRQFPSRKLAPLPLTGSHMYQAPGHPFWFPGTVQIYNRCQAHRPADSVDLGPVAGWCPVCQYSPEF